MAFGQLRWQISDLTDTLIWKSSWVLHLSLNVISKDSMLKLNILLTDGKHGPDQSVISWHGYVSKWGVRFWFQNGYFKGKNGHLILRHPHMFWCWFGNKGCTSWQEHPPTVIEIQTVILLWLRHLGAWHDFCLEVSFHNKFEILSLRPSPCPTVPCSVDPAWPESQSALWSRWRTSINAPDQNYQEIGAGWGWEIGINLFSEQTSYLDQWVWTPYHLVTWNSPFLTLSTIWNFSAMVSLERAFRTLGSGLQRPIKCRSLAAAVCLADKAVKHWFGQGDKKTKGKTLYNTWLNLAQNLDGLQSGTVGKAPYFWDTSTLHGVEEIGSYASLVLSELAWHWLIIIFGFSRVWLALADNDNTDKVKYKYEHTWSK